ncbi:SRPBCC family protein [Paenarthrobacter sp. YAF11_1]|uniref:SRPBCC family protein n=1 Tax=Micrococcaceae TaxID=1268 RepID=UPI002882F294|nr:MULTISPECIES: SRPBCC family protein [unclassified Arthrobacter]
MTTKVNKTIMVNVPISTAYWQWTQFEEFPHFMGGVERVTRLGDDRLEWVAEIAGVHRKWEAKIVQQDVNRAVAWAAVEGVKNAGWVEFKEAGPSQTSLHLSLEYEPHGVLEFLGDKLHVVERQAESDLKKFKEYIEKQAPATGTAAAPAAPTTPIVDPVTHPFDQTNGLANVDGDSDGTADSDTLSAAERKRRDDNPPGFIPPPPSALP